MIVGSVWGIAVSDSVTAGPVVEEPARADYKKPYFLRFLPHTIYCQNIGLGLLK